MYANQHIYKGGLNPWLGLIFILVFSFWGMNGLFETGGWVKSHLPVRYGLYVCWLIITALIGWWSLKGFAIKWLLSAWLTIYGAVLAILILLGLFDFVFTFPYAIKKDANHLRTLFMSPLPFVIFWIVAARFLSSRGHSEIKH